MDHQDCYNCKKDMSAKQDPNSGYMIFKWDTVFSPTLKKI
jgi:hypothetical protein